MKKKWMLKVTKGNVKELSKMTGISEILASILINRNINSPESINEFLNSSIDNLIDGMLMKDMDKGTEIIKQGIMQKKKIIIYGDYDCDGVTSTVILYKALKKCGAEVKYYIPDRESEGYGMCTERIKKLKEEENAEIILTCDNGIAAVEQIEIARKLGLIVVVTDHHEVGFRIDEGGSKIYNLPDADAIINPKQFDCSYPFKALCGAGVSFKFAEVLFNKMGLNKEYAKEFIEFAAIGTTCDVVDLNGENRILVKTGLEMLRSTSNIGLKTLIKETGLEDKKLNTYHLGYIIGPCINATGRLDTAALSVELLLCEDNENAQILAKKLCELNTRRQYMTMKSVEETIDIIEGSDLKKDKVLVVYKEGIHESIAGIVAGRIRERYNSPTIILCDGKEIAKGSGRSIDEYNMFEELNKCKEYIEQFGGHPMAAGLSIKKENIPKLRLALNNNCTLSEEDLITKIRIDKRVNLRDISINVIEELKKLEPFGKSNEMPLFAEKNILIDNILVLGKDKNTLKFQCRIDRTIKSIDAIAFGKAEEFNEMLMEHYGIGIDNMSKHSEKLYLDMIYYPDINEYKGIVTVQLKVIDFRISENLS